MQHVALMLFYWALQGAPITSQLITYLGNRARRVVGIVYMIDKTIS